MNPLEPWPAELCEFLTTADAVLDRLLRGGVQTGGLTEIVGESTSAKTQLCLQLLLAAQLPKEQGGLGGRALYIYTEGKAPLDRLEQLAQARFPSLVDASDLVMVANASAGPEQLREAISQASVLCASPALQPPVRLVVLDSLAYPFRDLLSGEPGCARSELAERARLLYEVAASLKAFARRHRLAVVVTNHVVDVLEEGLSPTANMLLEQATGGARLVTSGRRVQPALGLYWANCVSTRLFLSRLTRAGSAAVARRRLSVVFAPHLEPRAAAFSVSESGVHGEEGDGEEAAEGEGGVTQQG
jgi:DNA-repair protein XRCC3